MAEDSLVATVIVPCFNEEGSIRRCLEALREQSEERLEVLVVDDGSTDATRDVVADVAEGEPRVRLLRQEHQGPARARNLAAAQARGEVLVFVDADMFPAPGYVEHLVAPIRAGEVHGTFTREERVGNVGNYWADCWCVASGLPVGARFPEEGSETCWLFRALRRTEFERVGGYPDVGVGGVGEDLALGRALGYPATAAPGAVCLHDNPETLGDFVRSAVWYGKGFYRERARWRFLGGLARRLPPGSLLLRGLSTPPRYLPGVLLFDLALAVGFLLTALGRRGAK